MPKQKGRRASNDDEQQTPNEEREDSQPIAKEAASSEQPTAASAKKPASKKVSVNLQDVKVNVVKPKGGLANRKLVFLLVGLLVVAVGAIAAVALTRTSKKTPSQPAVNTNAPEERPHAPRLLDGTPADPHDVDRWPIAVMIDNLPAARPQSAISLGRIVYETLAEGGATRFMALYDGSENPNMLGPVRSSRHYFIKLAEEYQAAYVHAGASPQAASLLRTATVTDLNLIGSGARYGFRDKSRPAPHNLYTNDTLLTRALRDKDLLAKKSTLASWLFEPEPVLSDRPTTPLTVTVKFSSLAFEAGWRYNREENVFERTTGGAAHLDALTNQQVKAKTVVVMQVPPETSLGEKGRIDLNVLGEGKVTVFKDGVQVDGTWKHATVSDRTRFYDASGSEIVFHPGPIWIEVVPSNRQVVVTQ